jgi:uncharacterized protein (TIGR02118 family)
VIKSMTFIRKKKGMSREECLRYWKERHGPLAAKIVPRLKKYVQCHPIRGYESEIDGIVELWWESVEDFENFLKWRTTDAGKELRDDEEKFLDTRSWNRFVAEEVVIIDF